MILENPASIKLRQIIAPVFAASLPLLFVAGIWFHPAWWLLALELCSYALLALFFAARLAARSGLGIRLVALLPLIFATIHLTWGTGFLVGMVRAPSR